MVAISAAVSLVISDPFSESLRRAYVDQVPIVSNPMEQVKLFGIVGDSLQHRGVDVPLNRFMRTQGLRRV